MELKINLPFSDYNFKIVGVYKITFEDGCFYIGSSAHLRSRAFGWQSFILKGNGVAGKNIGTAVMNKIKESKIGILDIVELCDKKDLRDREAFYLDKYKSDPKMVSDNTQGAWKAVLQYKTDGLFIKKHYSIQGAARYVGATLYGIQRVLSGERKSCKEMVFVYEHDYHQRRKEIIKMRHPRVREKKNGRNILMLNENGDILKEFKRITDAAREVGCLPTGVSNVLNGHQKRAKGFYFKYT